MTTIKVEINEIENKRAMEKINEAKNQFFENNSIKVIKFQQDSQSKKERRQITNMGNKRKDIIIERTFKWQ